MDTLSPRMRTFGRAVEGGSGAPGLHTASPVFCGPVSQMQLLQYVPVSLQRLPLGQQVCELGQHTASSYGQQPCPYPSNGADRGAGGGAGEEEGGGGYIAAVGSQDLRYVGYAAAAGKVLCRPGPWSTVAWGGWESYLATVGGEAVPDSLFGRGLKTHLSSITEAQSE